jgi:hypothetical protein
VADKTDQCFRTMADGGWMSKSNAVWQCLGWQWIVWFAAIKVERDETAGRARCLIGCCLWLGFEFSRAEEDG